MQRVIACDGKFSQPFSKYFRIPHVQFFSQAPIVLLHKIRHNLALTYQSRVVKRSNCQYAISSWRKPAAKQMANLYPT